MSSAGSGIGGSHATGRSPRSEASCYDSFAIDLTEPGIAKYVRRYQTMLAARQQDPEALRQHYRGIDSLILSIDGLQPEKGHETLYVVRELTGKRVWFAEALLSATADEVRRLITQAKQWADALGKPVALWISDKQDAFVTGIAAEFPDVPHRYCANHFLRDLAKPVLEADSHAKVQMRKKVRGLRGIERSVLDRRRHLGPWGIVGRTVGIWSRSLGPRTTRPATWSWTTVPRFAASSTTIKAVRSILPDCEWPRRWTKSDSRSTRNLAAKKGVRGDATEPTGGLHRQGLGVGEAGAGRDPTHVATINEVAATLDPAQGGNPPSARPISTRSSRASTATMIRSTSRWPV